MKSKTVSLAPHTVPHVSPLDNGFALKSLTLALVLGLAGAAQANPSGGQVVAGTATIKTGAPGTLNISQSTDKAIINWQSFSIAAGETVNFLQPGTNSVTLNRVLGNDPSSLFGQLNAKGTVMLVNPNGIVFGAGSRVDVGGLVASTADIANDDFLASRYLFSRAPVLSSVENHGLISIRDSGLAALVAPQVRNDGVIQARLGRVALGAAQGFTLDLHGDGLLSFAAGDAVAGALVANSGTLSADGGTVLLTARALKGVVDQVINTRGVISASSVGMQQGRIVLSGGDSGQVAVGGQLSGASITATGQHVEVTGYLDASAQGGGGEIAIGSQGRASGYAGKSQTATVTSGAVLKADALGQGDGGVVTVWSTDTTRMAGAISARGGEQGGNGGFAEVSSKKGLALSGSADLRAPQGQAGTLLLDPTSLRITDSASGGSQDGNAGDGNVAGADADAGLNTISRGLLESLSGTSNIVLQATGLITVDAMPVLDLATTAGHGFTLQSTQSGGIVFADANTQIRTQGGSITLLADGLGSSLANIGVLNSNGGAITLKASGDVMLAGAIHSGGSAISVQSSVGNIRTGTNGLLTGGSIELAAAAGNVGAAGSAITINTADLRLQSAGNVYVSNGTALTALSLTANHLQADTLGSYQISAPGLTAQFFDTSGALAVQQVEQDGLHLTLASDRSLQMGRLDLGAGGTLSVKSAGELRAAGNTLLTAGAGVTLSAGGAIGSSSQRMALATSQMSLTAGGDVYLVNDDATTLAVLSSGGSTVDVRSDHAMTIGAVNAGSAALTLGAGLGGLLDDGDAATLIQAGTLQLYSSSGIGGAGARLRSTAGTIAASAGNGSIYLEGLAASTSFNGIHAPNGGANLLASGSAALAQADAGTQLLLNAAGSITVGSATAPLLTLNAAGGSITSSGSGSIGGTHAVLNAAAGTVIVDSTAAQLDVQAQGYVSITQSGALLLNADLGPSGGYLSVSSSSGDLKLGSIAVGAGGSAVLSAAAGNILDDGNSGTRAVASNLSLTASGSIGTPGAAVQTNASGLTLINGGDLVLENTGTTLSTLAITNTHATPGAAHALQISSPYLAFDASEAGGVTTLRTLASQPLYSLSFSSDQSLVLGQIQAGGTVGLTSTQGDLLDDGNSATRITATGSLVLKATLGHVGSATAPLGVNASSLNLTTHGNLYVSDIADIGSLSISAGHVGLSDHYGIVVSAPKLQFSLDDSGSETLIAKLVDASGMSFTFSSDRGLRLGDINVGTSGSVSLTGGSGGGLFDDGDKSTRVLANSVTLVGDVIGAAGSGHLDIVTSTLSANARVGGLYVDLPNPTGSSNTTGVVNLSAINAAGPVQISAEQGDLQIGGSFNAAGQAVSLSAAQGSILNPYGQTINLGSGSLTLLAGGAIGSASQALAIAGSGTATLDATAGSTMNLSGSGPLALHALVAPTSISYSQSSGDIGGGSVQSASVSLSAAQGGIGNAASPLAVHGADTLTLSARGEMALSTDQALTSLSLTRVAGSSGPLAFALGGAQSLAISEDAGSHTLQSLSSPATPLAFSFSGTRELVVGQLDAGSSGSITLATSGGAISAAAGGSGLSAATVSLSSGGAIGSAGAALQVHGSTGLALSGGDLHVDSDTALASLAITSTKSGAATVAVTAPGQSYLISDSGTTQLVDVTGSNVGDFSLATNKNIEISEIVAAGTVSLTTTGSDANSNIRNGSGSGYIHANLLKLATSSTTAGGGSIGSSGSELRIDTPSVVVAGSADIYLSDAQDLSGLDMTVTHGRNVNFGYGINANNLSFSLTDGNTQSLSVTVTGAMDFAYSVDRGLSVGAIDVGTSSAGSLALTSRSAPSGTNAQINRANGSLTGGHISLTANGTNGGVGAAATLATNTQNLSISSGGNVSVSNSSTLSSLSLEALHRTSGVQSHTYSISSTGLTFSINDNSSGNDGLRITNISESGLALSLKTDRLMTVSRINTGFGSVALTSSSAIQGGSGASAGAPSITTGDLVLNGSNAYGYQNGSPLYTSATTLASTLANRLNISNAGSLTLLANTVGSNATITSSSGSLMQGSGGLVKAPVLALSANQSIGDAGTLRTDARQLTLTARQDIAVDNASDLFALSIVSTHGTPGAQNTISLTAPRLNLALTDSVAGDLYHLATLSDASGLDFSLSTDVDLSVGSVDVQAARTLRLATTGSARSIVNDGASLIKAGSVTLSADGSVGAAGGSGTRMQTDALALAVTTGANAFVDNAQVLSGLSLTSTQAAGGSAPVYEFTAPSLSFFVSDAGSTAVSLVGSSAGGLAFSLNTRRDQLIGTINVGTSGSVNLQTSGAIDSMAGPGQRIVAGSVMLTSTANGTMGSQAQPLYLSAPLVSVNATGGFWLDSDVHIDRLALAITHPGGGSSFNFGVDSATLAGTPGHNLLRGSDNGSTTTTLSRVDDGEGLSFSLGGDRSLVLGALNLGQLGTAELSTNNGSIDDDGSAGTQVQAASLSLSASGAIGSPAIQATVNTLSASAASDGVALALNGPLSSSSISAHGAVQLDSSSGDIALGGIDAGGNAVVINNSGGSILSGYISNAGTVSLIASGSIGNDSAISTYAGGGGTTTLSASAGGSIALSEGYALTASTITAGGDVTLGSNYGLGVGSINSSGAVTLSSNQNGISGTSISNLISADSVTLNARYGSAGTVGSSGTRLRMDTTRLTLNTPASFYVTVLNDLASLDIDRGTYSGSTSSGTMSLVGSNVALSATDNGSTATLNSLIDSTGLDLSFRAIGSLALGTVDVGGGSASFIAAPNSGSGSITAVNASSSVHAGSLVLQAQGSGSAIGSSSQSLNLSADTLTASADTGGIYLATTGALALDGLTSGGVLKVQGQGGDLTLGSLSWGSSSALDISASGGRLLGSLQAIAGGGSSASITLAGEQGVGTALAPVLVDASGGSAVHVSSSQGSVFLGSQGTLSGGLTATAAGNIAVSSAGDLVLSSLSAAGDISASAASGDISVGAVHAGLQSGAVALTAAGGRLLASGSTDVQGHDILLSGADGVGSSANRMPVAGDRVRVASHGGDIWLDAGAAAALPSVVSQGGDIDIRFAGDLLLTGIASAGGTLKAASTGGGTLTVGSLDAGGGVAILTVTGNGGRLVDDGDASTVLRGGTVGLAANAGIGSSAQPLQTAVATLVASNINGGIYIADSSMAGVTLGTVVAGNGPIRISAAGPMVASSVISSSDSAGNDVQLSTSSGDISVGTIQAGATQGAITLDAAGSIIAGASGNNLQAAHASLTAGGDIGTVSDLSTGAGTPLQLAVGSLDSLTSSGSNRVVSLSTTGSFTLGSSFSLGSGSSAYLQAGGDLDVSAGLAAAPANLLLQAGGVLTLPSTTLAATGAVTLIGSGDIVAAGGARTLNVNGSSLDFRSGAAGGDTTLIMEVGSVHASLTGPGNFLVVNYGPLAASSVQTADGDILFGSLGALNAASVIAGGTGRNITLVSVTGDLTAGTIDAGSTGSILMQAQDGALQLGGSTLTAQALSLSSSQAIGSAQNPFVTPIANVSAEVTGSGGIHLSGTGDLVLGSATTADGELVVNAVGQLTTGALSVAGNVSLNAGTTLTMTQAYTNLGSDPAKAGFSATAMTLQLLGVTTSGAQQYSGALQLGGDLVAQSVSVSGNTVAGSHTVTTSGDQSYIGDLSASGLLSAATLSVTGSASVASVTTTGLQNYGGGLLATGTLSGGSLAVIGNAQIASVGTSGDQSYQGDLNVTTISSAGGISVTGNALIGSGGATGSGAQSYSGTLTATGAIHAGSVLVDGAASVGNVTSSGAQIYHGSLNSGGALSASSLTVDGNATLASVSTTGNQQYGGSLNVVTILSAQDVNVDGAASVGSGGAYSNGTQRYAGTLDATGAINASGLTVGGDATLAGVGTSGNQQYGGRLTVATIGGASAVTVAGALNASGAINAASLDVSGSAQVAAVTTTDAQTYRNGLVASGALSAGSVAVTGDASLVSVSSSGAQSYGGNLNVGTIVNGGAVSVGGTLEASGAINAASLDVSGAARVVDVSTSGAQRYAGRLDATGLLSAGSLDVGGPATLARVGTGSGDQHYGNALTVDTIVSGSAVSADAALTATGGVTANSLTVQGVALLTEVTTTGAQHYGSSVVASGALSAGSLRADGDATLLSVATSGAQQYGGRLTVGTLSGAAVSVVGMLDASGAINADSLDVGGAARVATVTTGGSQHYAGSLLASGALSAGSLAVDGDAQLASVSTVGAQQYGGALDVGTIVDGGAVSVAGSLMARGSLNVASLAVQGPAEVLAVTSSGSQAYAQGLSAHDRITAGSLSVGGDATLAEVSTGSGAQHYGGALSVGRIVDGGAVDVAGTLDLSGTLNAASLAVGGDARVFQLSTSGEQRYGAALSVARSLDGGAVHVAGPLTAAGTVTADSLDVQGTATVLGVTTRGAQHYGSDLVATGTLSAGSLAVDGDAQVGNVQTDGAQRYAGSLTSEGSIRAGSVSVQGRAVLAASAQVQAASQDYAGGLDLAGHLEGDSLTVAGVAQVAGSGTVSVGSQRYEGGLQLEGRLDGGTVAVLGDADIRGGSVVTTGAQQYGGALTLAAGTLSAASLSVAGDASIGSGGITTTGAQVYQGDLALGSTALRAGTAMLRRAVDAMPGDEPMLQAGSLSVAGATTLGPSRIVSSGAQDYQGSVTLQADTTLDGAVVNLRQGASGGFALSLSRDALLAGAIDVASLEVGGATAMAATVHTSGMQRYGGPVTLVGDVSVSGQGIHFAGRIDGGHALAVNSGAGDAVFAAALGESTRLAAVTVDSSGLTRFGGSVQAASLRTDAAGTLSLGGGLIRTTGALSLGERALLTADTTLAGSTVMLAQGADGAQALTIVGAAEIGGALGAQSALQSLRIDGPAHFSVASVKTTGSQHYGGSLDVADGDLSLQGGDIAFDAPVTVAAGAVAISSSGAMVSFAPAAIVQAATGFVVDGASGVLLPTRLSVTAGDITIAAPVIAPAGAVSISTVGNITISGLSGAQTALTLSSGSGLIKVGLPDADPAHKLIVASLAVPSAAGAQLYGSLGGRDGAFPASQVLSGYVSAPYYFNDTPWGPLDLIATVVATTTPTSVVPSQPELLALFDRGFSAFTPLAGVPLLSIAPQPLKLTSTQEDEDERKKP